MLIAGGVFGILYRCPQVSSNTGDGVFGILYRCPQVSHAGHGVFGICEFSFWAGVLVADELKLK